ncbi:MAG: phosphate ABC transporter substrate-binding protein [Syntrophomonas sp.]|nr:phosphate ABC transporter substrate-binding protein [Syntrophomonas sp.]
MGSEKIRRITSFLILGLLLVGTGIVTGCGSKTTETPTPGQNTPAALSGSLTIAGSTSVQPFSEVLAEEFMAKNKGVQINVQGGGSSVGIEAAVTGAAQIGASSRAVKAEETAKGLTATTIALDGIAVVVNPANTLTGLTTEQVMNIYLGNIKNWNEVGGPDAVITVVTREEGSGTRDAFSEIVLAKKDIIKTAIVQNSTGAVRTTVAGDKNAIGYVSLSSLNQEVKALDINGAAANEANVKAGTYKIQRPFIYVTKGAPSGLAQAFIDYVLSPEGQQLIVEEGAFSIK